MPPRSRSRRRRLPRWVWRPVLPAGLLAAAVLVSVAHGQPPVYDRSSGASVPVRTAAASPQDVGDLLLVTTSGAVTRFDTGTRRQLPLALPAGAVATAAWTAVDTDVVLGRLPDGRSATWTVRGPTIARFLAPAEAVVPSADGRTVWLQWRGVATRVVLQRGQPRLAVRLPRTARLVADVPRGLVVTTGSVPDPTGPSPTGPSPTGPSPTGPTPPATTRASTTPTRPAASPLESAFSPAAPAGDARDGATAPGRPAAGTPTGSPFPPSPGLGTPRAEPPSVPLTTLLVDPRTRRTRFLAAAEGLAAVGETVLVRGPDARLGVVDLAAPVSAATPTPRPRPAAPTGTAGPVRTPAALGAAAEDRTAPPGSGPSSTSTPDRDQPTWLPVPSSLVVTGPGAVSPDGLRFAAIARQGSFSRLMVGRLDATDASQVNVVALDGSPPLPSPAPPAFAPGDRVLAARPDGQVVVFTPGDRAGSTAGTDLPPAYAVRYG